MLDSFNFCALNLKHLFLCGYEQHIVIGTPGRLRDLMEMGLCSLNEVSFVVSSYSYYLASE